MALYKALKTFAGKVTMTRGEVKNVDDTIAASLVKAKYLEAVSEGKKSAPATDEEKPKRAKKKEG